MVAVSIVVATEDPGPGLLGLVRSVDAQTLPASEFELVVVDSSTDGSADRLQELARRRPNVVVVTAERGTRAEERLALAQARASGERLIVLAQDRRLAPRALELLLARLRDTGTDAVIGRVAGGARSGSPQLPDDADRIDAGSVDPATYVALVRADAGAAPLTAAGITVAAEGRYASAVEDAPSSATDDAVTGVEILWDAGVLRIDAEIGAGRPGVRAWLVAARDAVDIAVPATVTADGAVTGTLDPQTAEAGHPLADGLWDLRLRLAWAGEEATLSLPLGAPSAAIVTGRPFVVRAGEEGAQLDAGGTLGGVAGPAPQSTATVAESVHGILLTLDQPGLYVHGDADLDARLLLDKFALRARLVCRDGVARVETYASSLAGTSRIRLVIGGGAPVPTGLRLRVDGVGAVRVETAPPPRPKPAPKGPPPLVQRVRRLAPSPLEPAVHRLSRVPALRRAYRFLLSR